MWRSQGKRDTVRNLVQWGLWMRHPLKSPHVLGKALSYSGGKTEIERKREVQGREGCKKE